MIKPEIEKTVCVFFCLPDEYDQMIKTAWQKVSHFYNRHNIFEPHITIFMVRIPHDNANTTFTNIISEISALKLTKLTMRFSRLIASSDNPEFIFLELNKKPVYQMHTQIINILNKYRNGLIRYNDQIKIKHHTCRPDEIRLTKDYGYPYSYKQFRPHVSLARLPDVEHVKTVKNIFKKELSGLLKQAFDINSLNIGLFTHNPHNRSITQNKIEKIKLI